MSTRRAVMALTVSFALVAGACGGSSDEPATTTQAPPPTPTAAPTTPPPSAATTTAAPTPTTTTAPAPTTSTAAPLPEGRELLAAMNAAMARMPTFLGSGRGFVKETTDTPDSEAYLGQTALGGGTAGGDFWGLTVSAFNTPGLTQTFAVGSRTVAGVDYSQDPTGVWEIDDEGDPDPVEDAFAGRLEMADVTVETNAFGYTLTGTYPADPTIDELVVEINANTNRVRSVATRSRLDRGEFEGLIPAEGGDLVLTQRVDITAYDLDMPPIAVPPVGRVMAIVPELQSPFSTLIPSDWEQLPDADINALEVTDAYIGPEHIGLLVLVQDLAGSGVATLDEYVNSLVQVALAGSVTINESVPTSTLQGERTWIGTGTVNLDGSKFRRLVYVSPNGLAVNLTFVQGVDDATNELTSNWDTSQDLIDFMINSFMVFFDPGTA